MSTLIPMMGKTFDFGQSLLAGMDRRKMQNREEAVQQAMLQMYGDTPEGTLASYAPEVLNAAYQRQKMAADASNAQEKAVRDREAHQVAMDKADREAQTYQQEQVAAMAPIATKVIRGLLELPEEQRAEAFQRQAPEIIKQYPMFGDVANRVMEDGLLTDDELNSSLQEIAPFLDTQKAPQTRKLSLPGGMIQDQELVNGEWSAVGEPYSRREASGSTDITINTGDGIPLDKTGQRNAVDKVLSAGESLRRLGRIGEDYKPQYLTYQGKVRAGLLGMKDKTGLDLTQDEREFMKGRRKFTQNINREFNAYRKEITGAAASVQELESLKLAMLSEDLSPAEFEAAFNEYIDERRYTVRIYNRVLREGLRPGTKQFGERLDDLWLGGEDDAPNARGDEVAATLRKQGLPEEEVERQVMERLVMEGYAGD